MAYKKAQRQLYSDLNSAHAEYDRAFQSVSSAWSEFDKERDQSLPIISDVEALAASIRKTPTEISIPLQRVSKEKQKFISSADLKKRERKEKMAESSGAIAILAAGALAASTFWEHIVTFYRCIAKPKDKDNNTIIAILCFLVTLLALVFLFVSWSITRKKTAKEAAENIEKIKIASNELVRERVILDLSIQKTRKQREIVADFYNELKCYQGRDFLSIPEEHRKDLISMMNHAYTLAEMLNADMKESK